MINKNICLIGFMGSGKSSVARRLSALCHRKVQSTDQMIEAQEKRTIAKIFEESGEAYFRKREEEAVCKAAQAQETIIDCGGGVVLNLKNIEALKQTGVVIYLSASPEFLFEKIQGRTHRPLLNVENPLSKMKEMLESRKALYKQADYEVISENKTIDQIAQEIIHLVDR